MVPIEIHQSKQTLEVRIAQRYMHVHYMTLYKQIKGFCEHYLIHLYENERQTTQSNLYCVRI